MADGRGWKREGMGVLMIETRCGRMHCSLVFCSFLLIFIFLLPSLTASFPMSVDVDKEDVENSWYGVLSFFFVCLLEFITLTSLFLPPAIKVFANLRTAQIARRCCVDLSLISYHKF